MQCKDEIEMYVKIKTFLTILMFFVKLNIKKKHSYFVCFLFRILYLSIYLIRFIIRLYIYNRFYNTCNYIVTVVRIKKKKAEIEEI